jgi:hypothetical protein
MTNDDRAGFAELMTAVYSFHRIELTKTALTVWWMALKHYDLPAITDAVGRFLMNPDQGQFLPKPADVVRMMHGTTVDSALLAWSMVERAVRSIGPYESVCFDDPIVNRVIADMGGWIHLGQCDEAKEWVFRAKEFQTRYRGIKATNAKFEHPRSLCGIAEAECARNGQRLPEPLLIGDASRAAQVYSTGGEAGALLVARAVSKVLSNMGVKPNALPAPQRKVTK